MVRIAVVGIPGCGKTSVLAALSEIGMRTYRERVDEWKPWLDAYYEDPRRHAFGFQVRVLQDFSNLAAETANDFVHVFERSPEDSKNVFGQVCRRFMTPFEWELYEELHRDRAWVPDITVYLRVSTDDAWNRVKLRGRESERNMSREYLHVLFEHYDALYANHMRTCVVDASKPLDAVIATVKDALRVHGFLFDP